MMILCPHCGHHLPHPLVDGLASCMNCRRVTDSSRYSKFLSHSWSVRKQHINDPEILVQRYNLHPYDAEFLIKWVHEESLSHEEFMEFVKQNGWPGKNLSLKILS